MSLAFSRQWAMPNAKTFTIKPIEALLARYIQPTYDVIDPFARDNKWATCANDLNPNTEAAFHMDAEAFVATLVNDGVHEFDVALLDPPYSPRQIMECYQSIGRKVTQYDTQMSPMYNIVKNGIDTVLKPGGIVISFGWNSVGMGINRFYDIIEIMLVCHGRLHNDTIVTVERKRGAGYL